MLAIDERGMVDPHQRACANAARRACSPALRRAKLLPREPVAARGDRAGARGQRRTSPAEVTLHDRTVAVASRPLATGGGVVTVLDLTVLRRLETIRRDFVANVSHELKTPLTAVSGFAETLLDDEHPAGAAPALRGDHPRQRDRGCSASWTTCSTCRASRAAGGDPNVVTVDVAGVVGDVYTALQPAAAAKGLALDARHRTGCDTRARRPHGVPADPHEPRGERGAVHPRGRRHVAHARGGRWRDLGRRARHRDRHRGRAPAAHLRALLPRGRGPITASRAARGSDSRSYATSPRRTAAASKPRAPSDAARRSACSFPPEPRCEAEPPDNRYSTVVHRTAYPCHVMGFREGTPQRGSYK